MNKQKFFDFLKKYKVLLIIAGIDVVVISLHVIFYEFNFSFLRLETDLFHLDREANVPTVYATLQHLSTAILCFFIILFNTNFFQRKGGKQNLWIWWPLTAMFLFLAVDEMTQLHENAHNIAKFLSFGKSNEFLGFLKDNGFKSARWLPFYIPIFLAASIYFTKLFLITLKTQGKRAWLIIFGLGVFLLVPILEYISTKNFNSEMYSIYTAIEESAEIFGTTFFLSFVWINFLEKIKGFLPPSQSTLN